MLECSDRKTLTSQAETKEEYALSKWDPSVAGKVTSKGFDLTFTNGDKCAGAFDRVVTFSFICANTVCVLPD